MTNSVVPIPKEAIAKASRGKRVAVAGLREFASIAASHPGLTSVSLRIAADVGRARQTGYRRSDWAPCSNITDLVIQRMLQRSILKMN